MTRLTLSNSFTETPGSTNGNIKVSKTIDLSLSADTMFLIGDGMKSYREFIERMGSNSGKTRVKNKLDTLRENLSKKYDNKGGIDPIRYLANLYYEIGLSANQILKRTSKLGLNYNDKSGITHLFNNTFGWTLRDANEGSEITTKLLKNRPQVKTITASNAKLRDKNIETFKEALTSALQIRHTVNPKFSQEKYDNFTGRSQKTDRIFYLLECQNGITLQDIRNAAKNSGIGGKTITRVINTKINIIKTELGITDDLEMKVGTMRNKLK